MSCRLLLALASVGLTAGCAEPSPPVSAGTPNVLLILIDCLRGDHVGVNGYERETTPNLDALAGEGVNFTRAFSQAQWTRPSVPSLLTGLYPTEHGIVSQRKSALAPEVETLAESVKEHGYATAAIGYQAQLDRRFGLDQGFDTYRVNLNGARRINAEFLTWALAHKGEPFFAYLHYLDIHMPYCPPKNTGGRFNTTGIHRSFCEGWQPRVADIRSGAIELSEAEITAVIADYDHELATLDERLGILFRHLKADDLWDETLIIVTSDHGEQFLEHGSIGHQFGLWDELIRVPLIVKPPSSWNAVRGRQLDSLAELRDVAPTILEVLGREVAPGRYSLLPSILGRASTSELRRYVVAESADAVVVRTADLKLHAFREGGRMSLFDLTVDPGETEDLAASRGADLALLRSYLAEWRRGLTRYEPLDRVLNERTRKRLRVLGYLD